MAPAPPDPGGNVGGAAPGDGAGPGGAPSGDGADDAAGAAGPELPPYGSDVIPPLVG